MNYYLSNPEQEAKEYSSRYKYLYAFVGISLFIICCRLWHLQIIRGSLLREFSEKNRIKETRITAPRGVILDRNGEVLVDNLPGFVAVISPQYALRLEKTAETVGRILDIPKNKIIRKVKRSRQRNGPFYPVKVKENLSREEVFRLKLIRLDHPGLEIKESVLRSYPLKSNGAQLFGYVNEVSKKQLPRLNKKLKGKERLRQGDIIGQSGLEKHMDKTIRGFDGVSFLEVDARGRERSKSSSNFNKVLGNIARRQAAQPGNNIQLTIDKEIQEAAYEAFNLKDRIGGVIAARPNGEIIAWVSSPSFDPNEFSTGISHKLWQSLINNPFRPMKNKVIQDHASPGSTFKPFVALAALQEGLITPETTYYCKGRMKFGRRPYHCASRHGHGKLNLQEAIERSCNIYFYKLGIALGIDRIAKYAKIFGFGKKTGIGLIGEVPGLLPSSSWKKEHKGEEWQPGENLSHAIGQGFLLSTPLQMAMAYSAIASHGKIYKPFLVKRVIDFNGQVIDEKQPKFLRDISEKGEGDIHIEKRHFDAVIKGLWAASNGAHGTSRASKIPGLQYAGKTGTEQLFSMTADQLYGSCEEMPVKMRNNAWYVAFAPHENPVITVSVLAEHGCHGSSGAAPVARDVIKAYIKKYHPNLIQLPKRRKKIVKKSTEGTTT